MGLRMELPNMAAATTTSQLLQMDTQLPQQTVQKIIETASDDSSKGDGNDRNRY